MKQEAFEGFDVSVDNRGKLEAQFIVPPFSVLDARQGYWQGRKRLWLGLGIKSELGRGELLTLNSYEVTGENLNYYRNRAKEAVAYKSRDSLNAIMRDKPKKVSGALGKTFTPIHPYDEYEPKDGAVSLSGTSIFDPVVCELVYKWFCPEGGHIYDPFAGGSVRGIVASVLGRDYTGIDLSQIQVEANKGQAEEITPDKQPGWIVGDSYDMDTLLPGDRHYDLIFSCPPYHDLERYTDDPADLSNMSWGAFKERYKAIIEKSVLRLNNNRFACFVVSEIRGEDGSYKGLVPYTIQCFTQGGARYYNDMILVNVVGSLPIRIAGQFAHRKIGRTHQNILVFYKGDMNLIPKLFKDIDTSFSYGGNNGE